MKRMITFLLVLAMAVSMIVAPAYASDAEKLTTAPTELCPCGCGKTLDAVSWTPWNANETDSLSSGHYYLNGDYVQDGQKQIMAGDHVVLDLRGHTITSKSYSRLLLVYGQMFVMDTVGGGRFMSKTSGAAFGGVVMVSTNEVNDSVFALLSGTITLDADNKGSRRGGLIHVSETATFRMTGGMLLNGTTVNEAGTYKEPGGCVAGISAKCTIEILGGQITGGESATLGGNIYNVGTTILKNCQIVGGVAVGNGGGNIHQAGGSLTIENCRIESGVSKGTSNGGGNICAISGPAVAIQNSTVRNGWSATSGGNIYLGTANATIENTKIEAGVAKNRGNNLYGYTTTALTIKNCDLPGDIGFTGKELKLEGKVKIGLLNHGLRLAYGSTVAAPVDASGLTEGSEIYVGAEGTFTQPGANINYFKGAIRTVLSETEDGLVGAQAVNGELGGYCPHCGEQVVWKAFSLTDSLIQNCLEDSATDTDPACTGRHIATGHYYLGGSLTGFKQQYVGVYQNLANVQDVVLDMAGYDITATHRAFYTRSESAATAAKSHLTILDSYGGSAITGSGADNQPGGVIYNESSKLTIYGGTYIYKPVEGRNITGGGVILNGQEFNLHGGTLDAGAFTYTDKSTTEKTYNYNGGALYQYSGSKYTFTMTAGRMIGGTAQSGGCAYFGYNNQTTITGGQFDSGIANAAGGGNIRMYGTASYTAANFHVSGASIRDGRVEVTGAGGGNLSLSSGTSSISDTYIEGGYAAAYGGNVSTGTTATIQFAGCIIEGGYAGGQSGNVHMSSTSTTTTWENCLFLNGSATYGGNLTSGNGNNTIKGGQILFGTARTSYGGNLSSAAGNYSATSPNYTRLIADDNGNAPLLAGGSAKTYGGNIYNGGVLDLQSARLVNGKAATAGQDLYMTKATKQGKLTVGTGVVGQITAAFHQDLFGTDIYGQAIARTVCNELNASIVLEGDYNNVLLCSEDGALHVGAVATVDQNGTMTWYTDGTTAAAACPEGGYVKFYLDNAVVLSADRTLDVNGNTVQVSGAYTVSVMDSAGGGKAVLAAETKTVSEFIAPNGVRYLTVTDGADVTAHPLDMKITQVSLRPSAAGIYYTGSWIADAVTSQLIESYGVAVSTAKVPDEGFMNIGSQCLWTTQTDVLSAATNDYSVLISGIMKTLTQDPDRTAEENKRNGETKIHAVAYVKLKNGNMLLSDSVSYSLYDVMTQIDGLIVSDPLNYRNLTNPMRAFHEQWADFGMGDWSFQKVITPEQDDVLNILMIGSSGCYYYVEELYGLLEAAGIKANVCNVYYSGCKLYQHYNWWKNKESHYEFFCTNGEGRKKTAGVSLEWCLAQQEWDVLTLQESGLGAFRDITVEDALAEREVYLTELYGYLKDQFPKADFYWHESAAYQIGYSRSFTVESIEQQRQDTAHYREFALAVCQQYDVDWIPRGDAKMLVREGGYDQLCARLGKGENHEGDYYHAGDIGGGQYLTACVWFETLTGLSPIGNPYRPVYTYNKVVYELNEGITYEALQEYAHQAVLNKALYKSEQ